MNYNIDEIKKNSNPVALFGAGDIATLAYHALKKRNIKVNFVCDSNEKKQGNLFYGIKIISPNELVSKSHDVAIFICNNQYIETVFSFLKKMKFNYIYDLVELLKNTDFSEFNLDQNIFTKLSIERQVDLHEKNYLKIKNAVSRKLDIPSIDIVITERCSLKCVACANLMQYYHKPQNSDRDLLFRSIDKLMNCIDNLYEFRVLGGDPFMNKQMYETVNKLVEYKNAKQVTVYTNATIMPKGLNLECLKHKKVRVQITNYGKLSYKHEELVKYCKTNNIPCVTERVKKWQDVGTINYENKTIEELESLFKRCCTNSVLTFLHGKLYRCPTSAHGTNLKAIPDKPEDIVNLSDDTIDMEKTRKQLEDFYYNKKSITACYYCKGRDYAFGEIDAAIQTRRPLTISKAN